ncbi:MAG: hypothetical protein CO127_00865 [Ignavibacteria bacterium CG_4_9_14_3_um_filter_36_18]|nr:MAG: hypothetical protein CO127_00865 [Ignavibacteria bacterium CG_4_9_14_3_um_filter_36_18]
MRRTFNFLFNLGEEVKEKKLSIGFLIDLSGSMQGDPLYNLKNALLQILNPLVQYNSNINSTAAIPAADEVMLMTFATEVRKVCPWVKQDDYDFFKELLLAVPEAIFGKSGCTALYDGVYDILNEFNKAKEDNEKILIIFSDGGEYGSKRKKSEVTNQIKKYRQGFLTSPQYESLIKSIDPKIIDSLIEKLDEDYVFKEDYKNLIEKTQMDEVLKKDIKEYQRNSVNDVKIYSLFYVGGGYKGDINLLKDFAKMTDGDVYDSPQEESIPTILNEMIMDILYADKSSLRTKLYRRLSGNSNLRWYKLFSFNEVKDNKEDCLFTNKFENPIYYVSVNDLNKKNSSREDYHKLFDEVYKSRTYTDFKNCVEANSKELSHVSGINSQLNVLIVFRGNDRLGISSAEYLTKNLRSNISKLIDSSTQVWTKIVILLEKFKDYSDQENQELYAFLNEINQTENDEIHTIYLISDYNKYAHNDNAGFSYLEKHQFEDLAAEILFDLNTNQDLDNSIIGGTIDQMGESSRFVAIGGTSAYLNKQEYTNALTNIFTVDFLTKLFNKDKMPFDENFVNEKLNEFVKNISYDIISKRLIECHPQTENMFQQLGCPSINEFTPFRDEILLKSFNKKNPREDKVSISRSYFNFVDYITKLYYDIIDYIDSSHSIEFFEVELDRRLDTLFKEYYAHLKLFVDSVLYGNDKSSSPLASKDFLERLFKIIEEKLKSNLENDFKNDPINSEIDRWHFTNSEGVKVPPGNPAEDIDELRRQIKNFPLPWSIRFRYGSFGALLGGITLTILWLFGLGVIGILPALLPAFASIAFGEYKVKTVYKKLQNIINKYEDTHKYYTWQKAFGIYCEKIKNFYTLLKEKVKREEIDSEDPFISNVYSENELIDLFSDACSKTIPHLVLKEEEQKTDLDKFHISLKPYILNNIYKNIDSKETASRITLENDIIDEMKKLGLNLSSLENPKQLLKDILTNILNINLKEFPSIIIGPIPIKFEKLAPGLQSKLDLIPIKKDREFLLTLLQDLTDDEIKELLEVWKDDYWQKAVDKLIILRRQQNTIQNNLFVLWREIVRYEIWLKKIKELIQKSITKTGELESKFNFDNVFYAWKEMYGARKKFKEGLNQVFYKKANQLVDASFDLWKIILGLKQSTNIHSLINGNAYPALSVIASVILEYPRVFNYYSSNESLSIANLRNRHIELKTEFPAQTTTDDWEFYTLSLGNDQVYFNKIYYLNLINAEKYSIFSSMLESFKDLYNTQESLDVYEKIKEDRATIKKLFLEEFCDAHLSDGKNIKKFHFIGEYNKSIKR